MVTQAGDFGPRSLAEIQDALAALPAGSVIRIGTASLTLNTSGQLVVGGVISQPPPSPTVPTSSSFTSVNLGTGGSLTGGNNAPLSLLAPFPASDTGEYFECRFAHLAAGSSSWSVTALLDLFAPGGGYSFAGLFTYNTSSTALTIFGPSDSGGVSVIQVNNATGYTALQGSSFSAPSGISRVYSRWGGKVWLRITCNGSTIIYSVSNSGLPNTWYAVGSQTFTAAGSPANVGFGFALQNHSGVFQIPALINLLHWEKVPSVVAANAASAYGFAQ